MNRIARITSLLTVLLVCAAGSARAQTADELRTVHDLQMEAMNAHDMDLWLSYCTDDFTFDYVPAPPSWNREQTKEAFESLYLGFPDFHVDPRRVLVNGNIVVDEKVITGTHQGTWNGIPASGRTISVPVLDLFEFEGTKLKKVSTYLDLVSWMMQIGAMPAAELPALAPSFTAPDPEPTGLQPEEAAVQAAAYWNAHDLESDARMMRPDAELFIGPVGMPIDRNTWIAFSEAYFQANSDLEQETVRAIPMGDGWVVHEIVWNATSDGPNPIMGLPALNTKWTNRGANVYHIDADGVITTLNTYWDNLTFLVEVGVVQPPQASAVSASSWARIKEQLRR